MLLLVGFTGCLSGTCENCDVPKRAVSCAGIVYFRHKQTPFGLREDQFEGEQRFDAGIDIAAPAGTPVRLVLPGRVILAFFIKYLSE